MSIAPAELAAGRERYTYEDYSARTLLSVHGWNETRGLNAEPILFLKKEFLIRSRI